MKTLTKIQSRPTTILTGFLGAGKTTYLNHLLMNNPETKYAIIENEYGEQSIDSDLIIRAEDDIVELNNGCLCCTLNDNLYEILNTLFDRKDEYKQVIIEATGVANPVGLAEPFVMHPAIKNFFPIANIVCLVDAELIKDHLAETEEAIGQITFSDVLLINKTDLIDAEHLKNIKARLRKLNPLARIILGNKEGYPLIHEEDNGDLFFEMYHKNSHEKYSSNRELNFPLAKPHSHHPHDHTEEIVSHTFEFDCLFDYETLSHQLYAYLVFQSAGLYRMKGIVWTKGSETPHIIQSVGKRLDITEKNKWNPQEGKQSRIVFIGKKLQRSGLEKLLHRCFA